MRLLLAFLLGCVAITATAQNIAYDERLPTPVARALKAAGIPFSHVLAQRHGEAWNRFFANRVGDDPELLAVFSLIGQEHDQVNDSRYAGAKEYLAGLFGARREE